jgi:hypothetical protein
MAKKDKQAAPAKPAPKSAAPEKPAAPEKAVAPAEAKPVPAKRLAFVPPPKPGGNYPGAGGKGGGGKPHGSNMPKGRIFRHQGR